MAKDNNIVNNLTTRVRQLILQYKAVKKENEDLKLAVSKSKESIETMQKELENLRNEYQTLKMAKMIEVTDIDIESAKKRVAQLIRDVNKCITLLSEK